MDDILYYIIHFACSRLKARCSVPRSHRQIIFSTGDWKYGIGNGEEEDRNEFDTLVLVVQGGSLLSFTPIPPKKKYPPKIKGLYSIWYPGNCLFSAKDIALFFDNARIIRRNEYTTTNKNVCLINIISQSEFDITLRYWESISDSRINSTLFQHHSYLK